MLTYSHHMLNKDISMLRAPIFATLAKTLFEPSQQMCEQLRKSRGLSPEILKSNVRMLPPTEPELQELLLKLRKDFHENELHTAGFGLIDGGINASHIGAVYRCFRYNLSKPVFLYNKAGSVYYLRPHKIHVARQELSLFEPQWPCDRSDALVIAEGEYKALASAQLGYPTVALNGLQSFIGRHFHKLIDYIKDQRPTTVVLILDHEYKPIWKDRDDETGPILVFRLGLQLQEHLQAIGINVRIGLLPQKYAHSGKEGWKVDVDGALAAGMAKPEYDEVIQAAVPPLGYIDAVCPDIRAEIFKHLIYVPSPMILDRYYAGQPGNTTA